MLLKEIYQSNKVQVSIELFPPKTDQGIHNLFQKVQKLKTHSPSFFSMTYGANGSTRDLTFELASRLKNIENVETTCHLTIVSQSKIEIQQNLEKLQKLNIQNIMALRGDPPKNDIHFKPHPHGFKHAIELVQLAKSLGNFSIAVAGFPEKHPESNSIEKDIEFLKQKVDAGADAIITQLFFDNQHFFNFMDRLHQAKIKVPVIPGILPIVSVDQVTRFTQLCQATIPQQVQNELKKYVTDTEGATQYGIELATKQCQELMDAGAPGIHFYALNQSRSVEKVLKNLGID